MSHELRTPLNIVIGYADLLVEGAFGALPQSVLDPLEKVREQSRELLQLIDATLDVNRLEAGRIELQVSEIELEEFLRELVQQLERLPRSPDVEFAVLARTTGTIRTDLSKLTVVIRNLVSNAFKFTHRGRVTLEAEVSEDGGAKFVVRDTGVGIPDVDKERIFEMFYQVSRPGQVSRGVGLGLYIVQQFTRLLGGKVEVQSQELVGTTFRVDIPALPRHRVTTPPMSPQWLADEGL
jgi:signal transduction histidine kinase